MRAQREVKDLENILSFSTLPLKILQTGVAVLRTENGGVGSEGQVAIWNTKFRLD